MSNDDSRKDLERPLANQPGVEELKEALGRQRQETMRDLENLGFDISPEKQSHFGIADFAEESEAIAACEKLNEISGVEAHQKSGRVIVNLDPPLETAPQKKVVESIAKAEGWKIGWYDTVIKG